MRAFFHSWRRKVGCVVLAMTSLLCGMWIRSRNLEDKLEIVVHDRQGTVLSSDGEIEWYESRPVYSGVFACLWSTKTLDNDVEARNIKAIRHLDRLAIANSQRLLSPGVWTVAYWHSVLPLTAVSAYLILWKPRKRTQNATAVIQSPQE